MRVRKSKRTGVGAKESVHRKEGMYPRIRSMRSVRHILWSVVRRNCIWIYFVTCVAFVARGTFRGLDRLGILSVRDAIELPSLRDVPQTNITFVRKASSHHSSDDEIRGKNQGICSRLSVSSVQSTTDIVVNKHPKFLLGIPSTLSSPLEKERRQMIRDTYLSFDKHLQQKIRNPRKNMNSHTESLSDQKNRVCSLQEWTCHYGKVHDDCQIIFAFFVGDNPDAPPYILEESLDDFRTMLLPSSLSRSSFNSSTSREADEEAGLVRLNIRENQFDGKMTTWFQFAALVAQEFPEIDYAVKVDSDTLIFTPNFLENIELRHWRLLSQRNETSSQNNSKVERIYGGVRYPKTFCGKKETHHACPLPLVGDSYMSGELSFMSMDLAKYIASDACPRDSITIPHEDVSISNYVYSYQNNPKLASSITNSTIDRIFIDPERILLTFNQSADWKSRKAGQSINLKRQFRKFLWGHCNPRPMKNDALYSYFKDPIKMRRVWDDFVNYYYEGMYGISSVEQSDVKHSIDTAKRVPKASTQHITGTSSRIAHAHSDKVNAIQPSQCAIMFFGLPRSYRRYVLPSILRNVVVPNLRYGCDYFVHYYDIDKEPAGRSGHGGSIDSHDILLLRTAIELLYNDTRLNVTSKLADEDGLEIKPSNVWFVSDTNETFWNSRGKLIEKHRTAKRSNGKPKYFPYAEKNYEFPHTMDNIVKQWHSINAVWELMEQSAKSSGKTYQRVAMLRSDVVFVDPIDIYKTQELLDDVSNDHVTIPNWAGWPVNDRMISGPFEAVKVWATERFRRLDKYVTTNEVAKVGYGMHPERFLDGEILPYITTELGYKMDFNKRFCFVRVRADGGIWIDDCEKNFTDNNAYEKLQRDLLQKHAKCQKQKLNDKYDQLYCNFTLHEDLLWNLVEKPIVIKG